MSSQKAWYVDYVVSISSMHLCHIRYWFFKFEKTSPVKIYMGNNWTQEATRKGKIK
jgi:hypothetical protein